MGNELRRSSYNSQFKNELSASRAQNELSICDIVSLDDENPWLKPPEDYSVAITGKAFNVLLNDPSQ